MMGPRAHAGDLIHEGIDDLLPVQLHASSVLVLQRKLREQHWDHVKHPAIGECPNVYKHSNGSEVHTFVAFASASGANDFGMMSFARAFMAETLPWATYSTGVNRTHSLRHGAAHVSAAPK